MADHTSDITLDSLPALGTMQFQEDERCEQPEAPKRRPAFGPLLVSMCLHTLGLYGLVELHSDTVREATPSAVAIHVRLVPPPKARAAKSPQITPTPTETARVIESTVSAPAEAPTLAQALVDLPAQPEVPVTIEAPSLPIPSPDAAAPTRLTVRQMVQKLRSEEEQQTLFLECTPLQRLNPMLRCRDDSATAFDYTQLDPSGAFFAERSAGTVSAANETKVRRIANSLLNSGMSQEDLDRYVQGIDVNSQQRSTSGDARASAVRDQMFRNDSTYQQKKRALNP